MLHYIDCIVYTNTMSLILSEKYKSFDTIISRKSFVNNFIWQIQVMDFLVVAAGETVNWYLMKIIIISKGIFYFKITLNWAIILDKKIWKKRNTNRKKLLKLLSDKFNLKNVLTIHKLLIYLFLFLIFLEVFAEITNNS